MVEFIVEYDWQSEVGKENPDINVILNGFRKIRTDIIHYQEDPINLHDLKKEIRAIIKLCEKSKIYEEFPQEFWTLFTSFKALLKDSEFKDENLNQFRISAAFEGTSNQSFPWQSQIKNELPNIFTFTEKLEFYYDLIMQSQYQELMSQIIDFIAFVNFSIDEDFPRMISEELEAKFIILEKAKDVLKTRFHYQINAKNNQTRADAVLGFIKILLGTGLFPKGIKEEQVIIELAGLELSVDQISRAYAFLWHHGRIIKPRYYIGCTLPEMINNKPLFESNQPMLFFCQIPTLNTYT